MEGLPLLRKLLLVETRRCLLMVGLVGVTYLSFQSFLLPYGDALRSLLPIKEAQIHNQFNPMDSSSDSAIIRNPLIVQAFDESEIVETENSSNESLISREIQQGANQNGGGDEDLKVSGHVSKASASETKAAINDSFESASFKIQKNGAEAGNSFYLEQIVGSNRKKIIKADGNFIISEEVHPKENGNSNISGSEQNTYDIDLHLSSEKMAAMNNSRVINTNSQATNEFHQKTIASAVNSTSGKNTSLWFSLMDHDDLTKRMKYDRPPEKVTSVDAMISVLARQRRSSRATTRLKWSSARDREILEAKYKIKNSPVLRNDPELDASLFQNVSTFKRSYELMERTLRVYVYKEGNRPIFHQPILKGLYSSEGWFMKLMEGNKNYAVKDPRKAHLFYIPFSSRALQHLLYVPNSHDRTNLRNFLKNYADNIAAKYPYFNRTGGADHFLVACHDWAPYVTRPHMNRCMKALCNADLAIGFKLGRDVSLPETYVRSGKNPLRDLGGKPPSQRHILAFYAGKMHGYLRTFLVGYWKDKDSDMKILGPMPPGVESKMSYIEYMKSSKYCICPKGYEVNSPRVVEALFYECVPVIVSDNFVLPFFDVLDWSAFSVVVAEKDIPRLKEILVSITKEKYLEMQLGVRKIQRHFLWHAKPLKYDLFHMILHSIWYNRVFQV